MDDYDRESRGVAVGASRRRDGPPLRSSAQIQLDAYSDQQLFNILERRVVSGVVENIVDTESMWAIARRLDGNAQESV